MHYRVFIIFLLLSVLGCASHLSVLQYGDILKRPEFKDHDVLYIESTNLTEDGSVLSSQDDEVLMFLYQLEYGKPMKFLLSGKAHFATNRVSVISFEPAKQNASFLLVLLEQDSERAIDIYEDIIELNIDQMILDHRTKNYASMDSYLGDDDIIAIQKMKYPSDQVYYHRGSHKGDQYEYRSHLKSKRN